MWNDLKSRKYVSKDLRAVQFGSLPIGMVSQQKLHIFVVEKWTWVRKVAFWLLLVDVWSGVSQPYREGGNALQSLGNCARARQGWRSVRDRVQQGNMLLDCKRWQEEKPTPATQMGSYSIYLYPQKVTWLLDWDENLRKILALKENCGNQGNLFLFCCNQ